MASPYHSNGRVSWNSVEVEGRLEDCSRMKERVTLRRRACRQLVMADEQSSELWWWHRSCPPPEWEEKLDPVSELEVYQPIRLPWVSSYRRQYISSAVSAWRVAMWRVANVARVRIPVARRRRLGAMGWMSFASIPYQDGFLLYSMTWCSVCCTHIHAVLVVDAPTDRVSFDDEIAHSCDWLWRKSWWAFDVDIWQ